MSENTRDTLPGEDYEFVYGDEEEPTILVLHDDEGNEQEFELLDAIEYRDRNFIVLIPAADEVEEDEDDDEGTEILILEMEESDEDDEEAVYSVVEDELLRNVIYSIFVDTHRDEIEIEYED
jgi:uncharacterized protein YrzB (UPF0473 family)